MRQTIAAVHPMPQTLVAVLVIFLIAPLFGCAQSGPSVSQLYEGTPLPKEEIATITEDLKTKTQVREIDGEKAIGRTWTVLPGRHSVLARTSMGTSMGSGGRLYLKSECVIRFEAQAGQAYLVTRKGEVTRKRHDWYDFDFAAIVANVESPDVSVGIYDCEIVSGGAR